MSGKGSLGISCPACGGSIFQLRPKLYFCANAHCQPGGRVLSSEEVVDTPGSSTSKCILVECTAHGRGRTKDDAGNGTYAEGQDKVQGVPEALA